MKKKLFDDAYQDDTDYYDAANIVVEADITAFVQDKHLNTNDLVF
jgi:hypothetical protein